MILVSEVSLKALSSLFFKTALLRKATNELYGDNSIGQHVLKWREITERFRVCIAPQTSKSLRNVMDRISPSERINPTIPLKSCAMLYAPGQKQSCRTVARHALLSTVGARSWTKHRWPVCRHPLKTLSWGCRWSRQNMLWIGTYTYVTAQTMRPSCTLVWPYT